MESSGEELCKLKTYNQTNENIRILNPNDIILPSGYNIEVFAQGLDAPVEMIFSDTGDMYFAESGVISRRPKIWRLSHNEFEIYADDISAPITGVNYLDGNIYVSHKDKITVISSGGKRRDVISGLPCNGDFGLSNVTFGPEGRLYFGIGTATNSGVVGIDNKWVYDHPLLHDEPAQDIMLYGDNYETNNMLIANDEKAYTGAFSPYGIPNGPNEIRKGITKASGSILRCNRDGSDLEVYAWGFRNPIRVNFNKEYQLFVANRGYDVRGSRPIANAPDEFHLVQPGVWYGWPDYCDGELVTSPRFNPEGGPQPQLLYMYHPGIPPKPFAEFSPHSSITGFTFNDNMNFAPVGDIFITEYGSHGLITTGRARPFDGIGSRVSRISLENGEVTTFVNNRTGIAAGPSGGGGLGRPVDVTFGPDGAMYILDMGIYNPNAMDLVIPNTGVIWRVYRT
jgi:glucose/arabinose dehydrogenase